VKEFSELVTHAVVEQNGLRPAFARAQHVAVREAAAGDERMEIAETATTGKQIAHMHVDSLKARAVERCRHLDMRVNALLAQYRDFRTRAGGDKRRGDILFDIERQFHVEARIAVIGFRLIARGL